MRNISFLLAFCTVLDAGSICGQVYYVAPDGNDTNAASRAQPLRTIHHAYGMACSNGAPAIIVLDPGTYGGATTLTLSRANVMLQGAGIDHSVIADALVVAADARLADLTCAAAFSNAASACLVNNVKLGMTPSGAGNFYGLWYDANDYAHLSSLTEPRDGFDAVGANWVSNHVRQTALPRNGGAISGPLYLTASIVAASQAVTRAYVDNAVTGTTAFVLKSGDTMSGRLHINGDTVISGSVVVAKGITVTGELNCVVGKGQSFSVKSAWGAALFSFKSEASGVEYVMHGDGWNDGRFVITGLNMPHVVVAKNNAVGINGAEPDWMASETRIGGDDCYVQSLHVEGSATVTGPLMLQNTASAGNHAVNKYYADAISNASAASYVRKTGDTLGGELVFSNVYGKGVKFLYQGNEHQIATDGGNFMQTARLAVTNSGAGYWWRLSSPAENSGNLYDVLWLTRRPEYSNFLHRTALRLFHPVIMDNQRITQLGAPQAAGDAATRGYVDAKQFGATNLADGSVTSAKLASDVDTRYLNASGDTMSGALAMSGAGDWQVGSAQTRADVVFKHAAAQIRSDNGDVTIAAAANRAIRMQSFTQFSAEQFGQATIPTGAQQVQVTDKPVSASSVILLTPCGSVPGAPYAQISGTTFWIKLPAPAPQNTVINYLILVK